MATPTPRWLARPRRPLYFLLLLALAAIALWGFWPRALPVETARIERAPLTVGFTEEGRTRLRDRYLVSAPLDGVIERVMLESGDRVAAGAAVAVMQPASAALFDPAIRAEADARWRAASDELTAANATVTAARAERDRSLAARRRAEALARDRLIADSDLDAARAQASRADADLRAAQAGAQAAAIRRDAARAVLDLQGRAAGSGRRLSLQAPVDGRVIRRFIESETPVRTGQAVLEIGDPQALEVVVETLTADAVRIAPGSEVRLLRWGGPAPLRGRVQRIEPGGFTKVSALGVEEQRVLVVVTLEDPPQRRPALADGFRVEAEFVVWGGDSVLTVPTAALFRDGLHWAVYAVESGRARLRHVRLGHVGENAAELREGLREGAQVVLYPGDRVRDGVRVAGRH